MVSFPVDADVSAGVSVGAAVAAAGAGSTAGAAEDFAGSSREPQAARHHAASATAS